MIFSVARTRDEAHLYLDLHPCEECGSIDVTWDNGLVDFEGELTNRYRGTCPGCGAEREYYFGLPEREVMPVGWPTFGGREPSQLLDAGEWLWVADLTASNVPADDAGRALAIATAAVEEVLKFIPPGQDEVPDDAFWSDRGDEVRSAEPSRFRRDRLLIVRDTYQDIAGAG
jgi:hypothetical protein